MNPVGILFVMNQLSNSTSGRVYRNTADFPRPMLNWFKNAFTGLQASQTNASISVENGQVVIHYPLRDEATLFDWNQVEEIAAFKRDLGTIDDIRLGFLVSGVWHEVSESDDGFLMLSKAMQERLSDIPEDWYSVVMLPAFETNWTTLWKKHGSAQKVNPDECPGSQRSKAPR